MKTQPSFHTLLYMYYDITPLEKTRRCHIVFLSLAFVPSARHSCAIDAHTSVLLSNFFLYITLLYFHRSKGSSHYGNCTILNFYMHTCVHMYTYEYSVEQTFANNSLFLCAAFKQGKVDVTLKVQSSNEYFCFLRKSKKIFHILLGCENVKDY